MNNCIILNINYEEAKKKVIDSLESGMAYNKFLEFIKRQGGDISNLEISGKAYEIKASKAGYISNINALELGKLSMNLGAGRENLEDKIDYGAGIILNKQVGDKVEIGDVLMTLYTNKEINEKDLQENLFVIGEEKLEIPTLIYKVVN